MKRIFNEKNRLIVIFAGLFAVVAIILLLVFVDGKKTYTVTFDLDGGTLQSGEVEQVIPKGDDAVPPEVTKEGYAFDSWSESYTEITKNTVIKAVWTILPTYTVTFDLNGGALIEGELEQIVTQGESAEPPEVVRDGYYLSSWTVSYNDVSGDIVTKAVWSRPGTTSGIEFNNSEFANYCVIVGAYEYLRGDVFLPSSYAGKAVLGIADNAFASFTSISAIYILDGIVSIGNGAFENCTGLTIAELPGTITHFGENAFKGCISLEKVIIHEGVEAISSGAFEGCVKLNTIELPETVTHIEAGAFAGCEGLEELIIHESVEIIEAGAFAGCENLIIKTSVSEDEIPEGWQDGWNGNAQIQWGCVFESESESETESDSEE